MNNYPDEHEPPASNPIKDWLEFSKFVKIKFEKIALHEVWVVALFLRYSRTLTYLSLNVTLNLIATQKQACNDLVFYAFS